MIIGADLDGHLSEKGVSQSFPLGNERGDVSRPMPLCARSRVTQILGLGGLESKLTLPSLTNLSCYRCLSPMPP